MTQPPPRPEWDLLLSAAQKNQPEQIRTMIVQQGVPATHANAVGQSALHIAALWGHVASVAVLLELGARPTAANRLTGATPLHMVVMSSRKTNNVARQLAVVRLLLAHGADPSQTDAHGKVPLDYCNHDDDDDNNNNNSELRALLAPQAPALWQAMEQLNLDAFATALHESSCYTNNNNTNNTYLSQTPLDKATELLVAHLINADDDETAMETLSNMTKTLLERGGNSDVSPPLSHDNLAPGWQTVDTGESSSSSSPPLWVLLQAIKARLVAGQSIPDVVTSVVETMATQAVVPLSPDDAGRWWCDAARRGHVAVLDYVQAHLPSFFHVNTTTNRQGMTALHFGARSGQTAVVQWLLQQPGIDLQIPDARGTTARQAALVNGHQAIVDLLDAYTGGVE